MKNNVLKKKRIFAAFLATVITLATMASCTPAPSNDTPSTSSNTDTKTDTVSKLPNDDSIKEFEIVCNAYGDVNPPMEEWWLWEAYEKTNGIKINWTEIPTTAMKEKKNLLMASSDKPDAFWAVGFSNDEISKYGSQGAFANLSPYMDEYGKNVLKLMDEIPGLRASLTMPDGNIYSLPNIANDDLVNIAYWYINTNWLDKVGKKMPTTIEELEAVYDAFVKEDANGNGDPNDEIPINLMQGGSNLLEWCLAGSYGLGNNGSSPYAESYYVDDDGKVKYVYTDPKLKEMWQLMKRWWDKKFFHPETFGTIAYERWVTDGVVNKNVGSYQWWAAVYLYADAYKEFTPMEALQGPYSKVLSNFQSPIGGNSSFIITDKCKAPATLLSWADYMYGEEGTIFSSLGIEGETYNVDADGNKVYIDEINNYSGGAQLGAFQYGLLVYGGGLPQNILKTSLFQTATGVKPGTAEEFDKYIPMVAAGKPKVVLPNLIPNAEEITRLPEIVTDINAYVKESRVKFVTGEWNFEADWDAFVAQLEKMGSKEYEQIKQAQYDRFMANL